MSHGSLVLLIIIHIIFDFFLQTREIATNKSSKFSYLVPHLIILFVGLCIYTNVSFRYSYYQGLAFVWANIILHGIIDWNIWRLYKAYTYFQIKRGRRANLMQGADQQGNQFRYWEDGLFYDFIAIDQALHGLCYIAIDFIVLRYV
jgi:hypothetical protein